MKAKYIVLLLLCICMTVAAQDNNNKRGTINNKHTETLDNSDKYCFARGTTFYSIY